MSFLKNIGKIFMEIIYIIIGFFITESFTIIQWLTEFTTIRLSNDQVYPIDLAINALLIKGIINGIYFSYLILKSSEIVIKFIDTEGKSSEQENYSFIEDITNVYLEIYIKARVKNIQKDEIFLNMPAGVSISKGKNSDIEFEILEGNRIRIPLKNIQTAKSNLQEKFLIDFKLIKSRPEIDSDIEVAVIPPLKITRKIEKNIGFLR